MNQFYLIAISFFLNVILCSTTKPQQPLPDSVFVKHSTNALLDNYKKEAGQNLWLYSGREYIPNGQKANGFAFFESDSGIYGSIYYDDHLYQDVKMRYDLVSDDIIINDFTNNNEIKLVKEKIGYFNVPNHFFLSIVPDKSFSGILKPGFYEQLCSGHVSAYAKHEKKLVFPSRSDEEIKYAEHHFYFMKIKNVYYSIENEHSILQVMKDKKDQIKKYIRENKISFKKNPEDALIKTAEYYSQLMN